SVNVLGPSSDSGSIPRSPTPPPVEGGVNIHGLWEENGSRTKSNVDLDYDSYKTDFEGVASHAGAITPFHLDSVMSGAYIFQFFGIKVVCSCPLNDHNWEVFKRHHLKSDPNAG